MWAWLHHGWAWALALAVAAYALAGVAVTADFVVHADREELPYPVGFKQWWSFAVWFVLSAAIAIPLFVRTWLEQRRGDASFPDMRSLAGEFPQREYYQLRVRSRKDARLKMHIYGSQPSAEGRLYWLTEERHRILIIPKPLD